MPACAGMTNTAIPRVIPANAGIQASFHRQKFDQGSALDPQKTRKQNPEKFATGRNETRESRSGSLARTGRGWTRGRTAVHRSTNPHATSDIPLFLVL
jgi:hypothetical protein